MPKRTLTPREYKHQLALYQKYHQKPVTCPSCGDTGQLYFRMQHGTRLWCVRHQGYDENGKWKDTYHHIGVKLPLKIIDQLEGRKFQKKITRFFRQVRQRLFHVIPICLHKFAQDSTSNSNSLTIYLI